MRYVTAAAALWAAVAVNRTARGQLVGLTRHSAGQLAVLGLVCYALTQGAQFVAIDSQPVATSSLFLALTPLVVGVASGRLLREQPDRVQAAAAVLVPAGAAQAAAIIAWLAFINTAVAFTLWNFSLRHLTAGQSSVVNNAMLPQIGLLGWVFFGEAPGRWQWAGMFLVSAGVVIGQHRSRAARTPPKIMPRRPGPEMRGQ